MKRKASAIALASLLAAALVALASSAPVLAHDHEETLETTATPETSLTTVTTEPTAGETEAPVAAADASGPLGAPENLSVHHIASDLVHLKWEAPANAESFAVTGYIVYVYWSIGLDEQDIWGYAEYDAGDSLQYYLLADAEEDVLNDGVWYDVQVAAYTEDGNVSEKSGYVYVAINVPEVPAPSAPVNLTVANHGTGENAHLGITWAAPADAGDFEVAGYTLYVYWSIGQDEQDVWGYAEYDAGDSLQYHLHADAESHVLDDGVWYDFRVSAYTTDGIAGEKSDYAYGAVNYVEDA